MSCIFYLTLFLSYYIIYLNENYFRKVMNNMTKGKIIKWNGDEIEFSEWTQKDNLETFVAETELGVLEVPIDPSTESYDDETGRTYFEATNNEYKTVVLF